MGWNGTRMKTSWVRLRGNASGRNGAFKPRAWHCTGCDRQHAGTVSRTTALDGNDYCDRQYVKHLATRGIRT